MNKVIKIFLLGIAISFPGSLPIGTLNITAFQLAAFRNSGEALLFVSAVIIVELVFVYITLVIAKNIYLSHKFFNYILPFGIGLLIYLAISSFLPAGIHPSIKPDHLMFPLINSSFLLGLLLSFLNPLQIPFWTGWNKILISKNKLDHSLKIRASYLAGIGLGSFLALLLFILAGSYLIQIYSEYAQLISYTIGIAYSILAAYLLFKFYQKRVSVKLIN